MKILITGVTGFIGIALARKLGAAGNEVRGLVRNRGRLAESGLQLAERVEGDVTDAAAVHKAVAGVEQVYHLAGTFREPGLSDQRCMEVNVGGTENVVRAALDHGVERVVHCSTVGIHGVITGAPAQEDHPLDLSEIYERTKALGEQAALEFGRTHGLPVTVLRPSQVYGPGDTRLLKLFRMANAPLTLWFGSGSAHYHPVYIDDLTDAFLLAGTCEDAIGEAFLIAGDDLPTRNELLLEIARALGKERVRLLRLPARPLQWLGSACEAVCRPVGITPPIYRRRVDFFVANRAYDISKARRVLGYEPRVALQEGLRRTTDWYRRNGHL